MRPTRFRNWSESWQNRTHLGLKKKGTGQEGRWYGVKRRESMVEGVGIGGGGDGDGGWRGGETWSEKYGKRDYGWEQ